MDRAWSGVPRSGMRGRDSMWRLQLASLGLALLCACATNPVTGRPELVFMSEAQEIALGRQAAPEIAAGMGIYEDDALQRYVEGIGLRMAQESERPGLPWQFRVVDDPTVNAFAVPGGFIYVTRGILAHMSSEAELASVLGHEIGHVTARHSVSQYTKQMGAQLVLLPTVFLPAELQGFSGALLGSGFQLLFLRYSRADERQSDELGLAYMSRAGYDPNEMVDMFRTLGRSSDASGGGRVPEWLATHPNPENREEMIQQRIALLPVDARSGTVGRAAFMQRLDGLAYGEDPRQGFFSEANVFHHPELAFRVEFPSDWKTVNQRQRVAALSPEQDAVIQLSLAEGDDPEEVARLFVASDGVSGAAPQRTSVNGLVAANAEFTASADGTPIRGLATFVKHGDHVFGLLGYAPQSKFGARLTALRGALASFARETDPAVLGAQPWRIEVVSPERRMSQTAFAHAYPGPASADELALLNQLDAGEFYPAGAPAKRIVGQALPR